MTSSSKGRALRRQVKKGMLAEIKRRTGRDVSTDAATAALIRERIEDKENAARVQVVPPEQK